MSLPAKCALAFMVCTIIVRGVSVVTMPIFTRVMPADDYGLVANYNAWASVLEILAVLGLTSAGIFNVGLNDYKGNRDGFLFVVIAIGLVATVILFSTILLLYDQLADVLSLPRDLIVLMFIHFIFYPAQVYWITRLRYEYRYKAPIAVTLTSAVLSQVVSLVMVLLSHENLGQLKLWSSELTALAFYIPIFIMLLIRGFSGFKKVNWADLVRLSLPLIPHYLAQHVMAASDRVMISGIISLAMAGIYSVSLGFFSIAGIFWNAANGSLIPYTYAKLNEGKESDMDDVVQGLLVVHGLICTSISLFAPEIIALFAPEEYMVGVWLVPPLMASAFLVSHYNLFANIEFYYKRTGFISLMTCAATVVNLMLNYFLLPVFGFVAAAYSTLVAYAVLSALHFVGMKRCTTRIVYDTRRILGITVAVVALCELCNALYLVPPARLVFILAFLVTVVVKRGYVINVVRSIRSWD